MRAENSEISQYQFRDLVDMPTFVRMLDSFFLATGIPNGVEDANGEVLSQAGRENSCLRFHRVNEESAERCRESNVAIRRELPEGQVCEVACCNGLMDYATPVVIDECQVATLFLGPVLHVPPDMAFFRAQAQQFGFNEAEYLKSIAATPVIDKPRMEALMLCMVKMAQMLAASGLTRLRQTSMERDRTRSIEHQVQLEDILESSPVAIGWSGADGRIEYINRQFQHLFGYTLDDIPDLESWYRQAYPDEYYRNRVVHGWFNEATLSHHIGTNPPESEATVTCKDGSTRRVLIHVSWVGERRLVHFSDITDHWLSEQRKLAHDSMLEMVAKGALLSDILDAIVRQVQSEDRSSLCSVLLMDTEGRHLLIGSAPDLPEFYNNAIHGVEIGMGVGSCGTAAYCGQRVIVEDIMTHEYWKDYKQLAEKAGLRACWSEPILSSRGKVLGTFAIYHPTPAGPTLDDIERIGFAANLAGIAIENRYTYDELERRAYYDFLTGLANRRYFLECAEQELIRSLRYGSEFSIGMMDVDHFKQINDTYGHKVGDMVLQKLSEISRAVLRDIDLIGRIGGEEFAILLPETGRDQAMEAAERLRAALAAAKVAMPSGLPLQFNVSLGVATLEGRDTNIDVLLNQADQALYKAKSEGRNRVCGYMQNE